MSDFPYPGLRPFQREETDIFFGREESTNQLIERLDSTHFVAVVGPSGCGKSSLVHTGLLGGLERCFLPKAGIRWRTAELRPSNRPFANLAKALLEDTALGQEYKAHLTDKTEAPIMLETSLRRGPLSLHEILPKIPLPPDTTLLLVVDQFEELFRYYQQGDKNEAAAFVKLLLESSEPSPVTKEHRIYIVITMRSDFIGDCTWFHGLPEAINNCLFLAPRLTREQLRLAIEMPAKVFGGEVEPDLVNQLLNEKNDEPDQLPLLQHALMRMWDRARPPGLDQLHYDLEKIANFSSQKRILTLAHYKDIGELKNALSQHAEEAYKELAQLADPAEPQKMIEIPKMAEILFRCLCERDPSQRDTRSPVKLEEVAKRVEKRVKLADGIPSWQQIIPVVDVFRQAGRYFLTPPLPIQLKPDSIIDISHESLIHHWQRLKEWTELEAKSVESYRRLEDSARRWEQNQAALWQSQDLAIAVAWREKEQPTAEWASRYGQDFELAMKFLRESEQAQQRQEQEKEIKRQEELKRVRKQRVWAITITGLIITGLIVAIVLAGVGYFCTT